MKLAVITNHEAAYPVIQYLQDLGAELCIFWEDPIQDFSLTSISSHHKVVTRSLKWVQKRFLAPNEVPEGKSRFFDLFRVVYQKNYQSQNADLSNDFNNKDGHQESVWQKLSDEMKQSLQAPLDYYEDVDAVLVLWSSDATPGFMGSSGAPCLGEDISMSDPQIRYGKNIWSPKNEAELLQDFAIKEVALVGEDISLLKKANLLIPWLKKSAEHRLFIITSLEGPWEQWRQINSKLVAEFNEWCQTEMEQKIKQFEKDLKHWDQLDDYIQVKIKKPTPPEPQVVFFAGHEVHSVDKLINSNRYYLTVELPPWKKPLVQIENAFPALKTISVDHIMVFKAPRQELPFPVYLSPSEAGFISIHFSFAAMIDDQVQTDRFNKDTIKEFEQKILRYFTPL